MSARNANGGHWRGRGRGGSRQGRGGGSSGGRNFERSGINSRLGSSNNSYNQLDDDMSGGNSYTRTSTPYNKGRNPRNTGRRNDDVVRSDPVISVLGFQGGHIGSLLSFFERECNTELEIAETKQLKDEVILTVKTPNMGRALVNLSGIKFSGSILTIRYKNSHLKGSRGEDRGAQVEAIKAFLNNRYSPEGRLLDLSKMDGDMGLSDAKVKGFSELAIGSKQPEVFFKLAQTLNMDPTTIVLSCNRLSNLNFLESLGKYLHNVTQLSFESNNLVSFKSISSLAECKDLNIEGLIFNDNPFKDTDIRKNGDDINYRTKISSMFPKLKILDGVPVQAAMQFGLEDVEGGLMELTRKIAPAFCDNDITRNATFDFLRNFFDLYDNNRASLIDYYETSALFSVILNTEIEDIRRGPSWRDYVGADRNLKKYTELATRSARLHIGGETIVKFITTLPKTEHPTNEQERFCFDAWQPDDMIPLGSLTPTVGAYIHITIHGEFTDVRTNSRRAFDRTFILSTPTEGSRSLIAGLPYTIISDALTLRPPPKTAAWINSTAPVEAPPLQIAYTQPIQQMPPQVVSHVQHVQNVQPENSLISQDQQSLVQALQQRTNLTSAFALQCLQEMNWDLEVASNAFLQLNAAGQIPADAFMQNQ